MYLRNNIDSVCAGSYDKIKKSFEQEEKKAELETFGIVDLFAKLSAAEKGTKDTVPYP